jgi:hypothetical protein
MSFASKSPFDIIITQNGLGTTSIPEKFFLHDYFICFSTDSECFALHDDVLHSAISTLRCAVLPLCFDSRCSEELESVAFRADFLTRKRPVDCSLSRGSLSLAGVTFGSVRGLTGID